MNGSKEYGSQVNWLAGAVASFAAAFMVGGMLLLADHYGQNGADARLLAATQAHRQGGAAMAHYHAGHAHRNI